MRLQSFAKDRKPKSHPSLLLCLYLQIKDSSGGTLRRALWPRRLAGHLFFLVPLPPGGPFPFGGLAKLWHFFEFLAVAPPNEGRAGGEPRGPQRCPKSPAAATEEFLANLLFYTTTFSPTLSGFGHWGGLCPGGLRAAPRVELAFLALGRVHVAQSSSLGSRCRRRSPRQRFAASVHVFCSSSTFPHPPVRRGASYHEPGR